MPISHRDARKLAASEAKASIASLFGDKEYSDLTIICGKDKYHVHKSVLCTRSDFFKSACRKDAFKEGHEHTITLAPITGCTDVDETGRDNPEAVKHMIYFLYHGDYMKHDGSDDLSLANHATVFAIARKYGISSLAELSFHYFDARINNDEHAGAMLKEVTDAIPIVFTTTLDSVDELRNTLLNKMVEFGAEQIQSPEMEEALTSVAGLSYLVLKARSITPLVSPVRASSPCTTCRKVYVFLCMPPCNRLYIECHCRYDICPYCGNKSRKTLPGVLEIPQSMHQ